MSIELTIVPIDVFVRTPLATRRLSALDDRPQPLDLGLRVAVEIFNGLNQTPTSHDGRPLTLDDVGRIAPGSRRLEDSSSEIVVYGDNSHAEDSSGHRRQVGCLPLDDRPQPLHVSVREAVEVINGLNQTPASHDRRPLTLGQSSEPLDRSFGVDVGS